MRWFICLLLLLLNGLCCLHGQSAPVFQNLPPSITINETMVPGQNAKVLDLWSTSSNRGQVQYSVTCVPHRSQPASACETFRLTAIRVDQAEWVGYIYLNKSLDSVLYPSYTLLLNAVDSLGRSAITSLIINIRTTRLRPPSYSGRTDAEIQQRTSASQEEILRYSALGGDSISSAMDVNYRILDGPYKEYFSLDPVLGRLTNVKPLQFSDSKLATSPAKLRIQAAYVINGAPAWDDPTASTTIDSTIFLRDQNLNTPTFNQPSYGGSIQEDAPPDTFVNSIFFTVEDKDRSQTSSSFELTLSNYNEIFQVRPSSGYNRLEARLSIRTNQYFNFNNGPRWYTFNVNAQETLSNQRKFSSAAVNVSLIQVNRFAPQFTQNPYYANVPENAVSGTPLVQVKAWDRDVGDFGNRSIWYRFSTGASELFKMDTQNGLITLGKCRRPGKSPCLDYEEPSMRNLRLLVWAADLRGEGKTGTTTVVVNVTNVNDNQPTFTANNYFATIPDGSTILSPLTPSGLAIDRDNNPITYTIESGNSLNAWRINPTSGQLTPNLPIKYSAAPYNGSYLLVIAATDGTFKTPATVNIAVQPINRYPPQFQQALYNVTIFETQPSGDSFMTLTAPDQDHPSTPGGKVVYRILSGGRGKFIIDANSGDVSVGPGQTLDYRTDNMYNMTVQANDLGGPSKRSETILLVYLLPKRPYIGLPDVVYYIFDGAAIDSEVTQIIPVTSQLGNNPIYAFNTNLKPRVFDRNLNPLPNPSPEELEMFRISRNEGRVTVHKTLDADRVRRWESEVKVTANTQANVNLDATGLLTIWISNANKLPPVFQYPWTLQNPFYNMTVQQGTNYQPIAGVFTATPGNTSLSLVYNLLDRNNFFELQSSSSGLIKQIKPINQGTSNYQLILTATDNGRPPLTSNATINVIVESVNQEAPVFTAGRYDALINDDAAVNSEVITVRATDQDKGDFGQVRYMLPGEDSSFQIDNTSGLITVKRSDFDAPTKPYILLEVRAYDSPKNDSKRKFAIAYVNVTVLDANNNPPIFQPLNYQTVIYTNLASNSDVIKVTATDADMAENAMILYSIKQGNDDGHFTIERTTGMIKLAKRLGADQRNYTLTVQATDTGNPSQSSTSQVLILVKVRCTDDCNPEWIKPPTYLTTVNVNEDIPVDSRIFSLEAKPYQARSQLDFGFARGGNVSNLAQQMDPFKLVRLNKNNKVNIMLSKPLHYNTRRNYELVTVVKDRNVANSEVLRYIVVNVLPVKKFNPRFPFNNNTFCTLPMATKLPQGTPANTRVAEVVATPNHIFDSVLYSIQGDNVPFRVDNRGQLFSTEMLNRSAAYTFDISASYTNSSNNLKQTQQLCSVSRSDQSMARMTVEVYRLFILDTLPLCFKENEDPGSLVENLNTLLQNPSDAPYVTYTPKKMNGFEIKDKGNVILENVQSAIESAEKGNLIPVDVDRTLLDTTSKATIRLKPYKIDADQPLTLITLNSTLSEFNNGQAKSTLLRNLRGMTNNGYQCIVDAGFHTLETGSFDQRLTDVYLYTIDGRDDRVIAPLVLDGMYSRVQSRRDGNILGITNAASRWDGFNWEPVAIAMGLIIGLLLLALLFFCCFCCWGYLRQFCIEKSMDKEPVMASNTGLVNNGWSSQPVLEEHPRGNMDQHPRGNMDLQEGSINRSFPYEHDVPDVDILHAGSYKSNARRDDVTTMDGAGSSVGGLQAPTGYVHIEAPLSRTASAFGAVDEVDVSAGKTVETTVTETVVRDGYDGSHNYEGHSHEGHSHEGSSVYSNTKAATKARAYSSRSGGLDDIDEGEDRQPVQLNESSASAGKSSQIGAVLIRPETPRGQGYTQRIVGGSETVVDPQNTMASYDYGNFNEASYTHDPARLNMAMQNEVVMNSVEGRTSYYDETMGTVRGLPNDMRLDNYANNGVTRQENNYMEQFEETKYL